MLLPKHRQPDVFTMIECLLRSDSFAIEAATTLRQSDAGDDETIIVTPSSRRRHL